MQTLKNIFFCLFLFTGNIVLCQSIDGVLKISVVSDSTGKPIIGAEVRMEGSTGSIQTDSTNKDGIAIFAALQQEVVYNISVSLPKYYSEKTTLYLTNTVTNQHIEFRMTKMRCRGNPLPQIIFKRNSVRLSKDCENELNTMVFILKENPSFTIAISGHTTPDEKEKLGQKRAEKVRMILINQGIDANQISIDTTQQCTSDCVGILFISNCDFRGNIITKEYLKSLSNPERKNASRSCRQVRFRITGTELGK